MDDYFRGTNLRIFILGAVVLAMLTLVVPAPERWRHTVGMGANRPRYRPVDPPNIGP